MDRLDSCLSWTSRISFGIELTVHLVVYAALIGAQIVIHRHSLHDAPFLCYLFVLFTSLFFACQAYRHQARLLALPLFATAVFDMLRFVICVLQMIIGTRTWFFTHCKIWFLYYHQSPESYLWAVVYAIISLYLYWLAATVYKYICGGVYRPLPRRDLPLVFPEIESTISRNVDSPPKYAAIVTQETPPPRYNDLKQTRI